MIYFIILFFFNFFLFKNFPIISRMYKVYDYPDKLRKKHLNPTPLLGGLFIYVNLTFVTLFLFFLNFQVTIFLQKSILLFSLLLARSFFF